jgi:molybdopterin synthase catalytic subunit
VYIEITEKALSIDRALAHLNLRGMGGLATFSGIARPTDASGRELSHIDYEAYPPMAEQMLKKICADVRRRWGVEQLAILHRVGRVEIGEMSVLVVAAAEHRREAFLACQYAIDTLKQSVPIWKKEVPHPLIPSPV